MRRFLLIILILTLSQKGISQYQATLSQYMLNRFMYNPAFAGMEDYIDVKSGYRKQWLGLNMPSSTFFISAHGALDKSDRTSEGPNPSLSKTIRRSYQMTPRRKEDYTPPFHQGLGLQLMADRFGANESFSAAASYAYHLPLGGEKKLSVGASIGLYQRILDNRPGTFTALDPNDPLLNSQGRLKASQNLVQLGAVYYNRRIYLGISAQQPIMESYNYGVMVSDTNLTYKSSFARVARSVQVQMGASLWASDRIKLHPSILLRVADFKRLVPEANLRINYEDLWWLGASYRHQEAMVLMAGLEFSDRMGLAYALDLHQISPLVRNYQSHELIFTLRFPSKMYTITPNAN